MPRRAALETLYRVETKDVRARDTLDRVLRDRSIDPRDRDLAHELCQGVLRHLETLDLLLARHVRRPLRKAHARDRAALRLGAYQIVYLDRVPTRAAVHATVEAVKSAGRAKSAGFVNAVLRGVAASLAEPGTTTEDPRRSIPRGDGSDTVFVEPLLPDPASDEIAHLAARWSHPEWLVDRFLEQHGMAGTVQILAAGIARPPLTVRPHPGHRVAFEAALRSVGVTFEPEGRCLLLSGPRAVRELPGFEEGWFAVQDATTAEVVPALAAQSGEAILEICAAPGGKTVEIAECVGAEGLVFAVDLPGARLERLERELRRRGLDRVAVLGADASDPESLPRGVRGRAAPGFDAVLVDVPCSNTGVLGRRVEARRRLEGPHRIAMLAEQAHHFLLVAASRVAKGGRLVFSTCSVDREENEHVVRALLDEDTDFSLTREQLTLPVAGRHDGGYFAVLARR